MCAVAFALVAAASTLDRTDAEAVRDHVRPRLMKSFPAIAIKSLGVYYASTIPFALLVAWRHRWHLRAAIFLLMTGLICLLGNFLKWTLGRTRPFKIELHS